MLETDRLLLRPFENNDLDELIALRSDRQIMAFFPRPSNREEVTQSLQRSIREFTRYGYWYMPIILKKPMNSSALPQ